MPRCGASLALPRLAADQFVELALRELAVVGDDGEVVLDLADDLRRLPQPLARVSVARRRAPPGRDVFGVELGEHFLQQLAAQQFLGTRAATDRRLELVVAHFVLLSSATAPPAPCVLHPSLSLPRRAPSRAHGARARFAGRG